MMAKIFLSKNDKRIPKLRPLCYHTGFKLLNEASGHVHEDVNLHGMSCLHDRVKLNALMRKNAKDRAMLKCGLMTRN